MRTKFKPGDKIVVYGYDSNGESNERAVHLVTSVHGDWIKILFITDKRDDVPTFVHRYQCRRLVKKTKRSLAV